MTAPTDASILADNSPMKETRMKQASAPRGNTSDPRVEDTDSGRSLVDRGRRAKVASAAASLVPSWWVRWTVDPGGTARRPLSPPTRWSVVPSVPHRQFDQVQSRPKCPADKDHDRI
jgi:hypothetical protein